MFECRAGGSTSGHAGVDTPARLHRQVQRSGVVAVRGLRTLSPSAAVVVDTSPSLILCKIDGKERTQGPLTSAPGCSRVY